MRRLIDLRIVHPLHLLILSKATGSHEELAKRLEISRSTLFDIISYLREEMWAPIVYNKNIPTYEYEYIPKFFIGVDTGLMLSTAPNSESNYEAKNMNEDDDNSDRIGDEIDASELNIIYGGYDYEWSKNSADDDSAEIILDDDLDFNNLFCIEY
jgi:hypothetical protein